MFSQLERERRKCARGCERGRQRDSVRVRLHHSPLLTPQPPPCRSQAPLLFSHPARAPQLQLRSIARPRTHSTLQSLPPAPPARRIQTPTLTPTPCPRPRGSPAACLVLFCPVWATAAPLRLCPEVVPLWELSGVSVR